MTEPVKHATFVFERTCAAPIDRVFGAFADVKERLRWGAPSENTAFFYEEADFRMGGHDVFRCGEKGNPQYRGVTTYLDIIPNQRIVSSETVETEEAMLMASLSATIFEPEGEATKVTVTTHVLSFVGDEMIRGTNAGQNASLDNLVKIMQ